LPSVRDESTETKGLPNTIVQLFLLLSSVLIKP
jgi:hypothetical protein